jgi:hypothetical protein
MDRKRTTHIWMLLLVVALVFVVPALATAQSCNPNHPETCSPSPHPSDCNPYHPETCPSPTNTHTGAAFFAGETTPSNTSDLMLAGWVTLGVLGLAFVVRRLILNASSGE